ncbi:hypothetical protein [Sphingomonas jatrophae]|uniref:Dolichyl-phosphate-mannose-protein mannosyltransferase n=1 Tax=Sphingomonas jatrophae TaxID=1166337 RepID=A0A1I6JV14_9SPHN|nr:hypothetical protein [Sphingomonas jatrophae]SFR82728.1 hypothetical protein SAMN05192580_0911 [Sphingomonas jatrophae]
MERASRLTSFALRLGLAPFALYALLTIPSLLPRWGASGIGLLLLIAWLGLAGVAWPLARGRSGGLWPLLVGTAVALRLGAVLLVIGRVASVGDAATYPALARGLLAGQGLVFHDTLLRIDFLALYPPAYPLLLAGLGAAGGVTLAVVWSSNVALDLLAAWLLARIGTRLGRPETGRAAAWLLAIWPPFVLAAPFAQKESLLLALVLGFVLTVLRVAGRKPGWRDAAAAGVPAALIALTQPGLAFFPALIAIALLPEIGWARTWRLGVRALPVAVLVMLPWWFRNLLLLHRFVPLTLTGGIGLWIGNNPEATGNWMPLPAAWAGMDELTISNRAAAAAKAWIAANPADFVRLSLTKLVRALGVEQFALVRLSVLSPAPPAAVFAALLPLCQGGLALLLGGVTAGLGRVRDSAGVRLALAALVQIALFGVWFEFGERHRYMLMPFLLLVAAEILAALPERRTVQPISATQPGSSASEDSSR